MLGVDEAVFTAWVQGLASGREREAASLADTVREARALTIADVFTTSKQA